MLERNRETSPWSMARTLEGRVKVLEAELAAAPIDRQKAMKRNLKINRQLLRWCKTRAGYVDPVKGSA